MVVCRDSEIIITIKILENGGFYNLSLTKILFNN